jgi:hypothetical protein
LVAENPDIFEPRLLRFKHDNSIWGGLSRGFDRGSFGWGFFSWGSFGWGRLSSE